MLMFKQTYMYVQKLRNLSFYVLRLHRESFFTCPSCHGFCMTLHEKLAGLTGSKVTLRSLFGYWVPTPYYCKMFVYDGLYRSFAYDVNLLY